MRRSAQLAAVLLAVCGLARAGYLGSWKIDDTLVFTANTHAAATGAATDADAVPTYRVYEDENGTAILNGSMAKIDDANTTGFYSEQLTLSAANGFEKGKSYTVYVSAAVATITGTCSHTFQIEAEVDADTISDTGTSLNAIPWNAAWDAEVESEVDDSLGGGTGTSLTAIPWNAAWDAEVESEVDDSLGGGTGTSLTAIPWNAAWDAEAQSEADDALTAWGKTGFSLAADQSGVTVGTVNTLTGHTAQTGDSYAVVGSGTHGNAALKTLLDTINGSCTSILADTGTDGVVVASGSKAGYSLANTGLDLVKVQIDGAQTTLPNAVKLGVRQLVGDMAIVGTTMTYSDADGNIVVYTLNDATSPTARTRN